MVEDSKVCKSRVYGQAWIPCTHTSIAMRRVRDPTASEVAMSPGPACRHTHTHISYFPFLFIRIAVGRGPLFESLWLGCHNRRAWWPATTARQASFSLAGYHSSPANASRCASRSFSLSRARAQYCCRCLPKMQWCLTYLFKKKTN